MSASPLSSLCSPTPETIPVQPDHFYGHSTPTSPDFEKCYLDPEDDPFATRGIPVFKPDIHEFNDFEGYMSRIEAWGMKSGIVKIVPPKEWAEALPSTIPQLAKVKLRHPIEQQMVGRGGLFRQQNVEKRRIMSVREWAELCTRDDLRAPTITEAQGGRRHAPMSTRPRPKRGQDSEGAEEQQPELPEGSVDDHEDSKAEGSTPNTTVDDDVDTPMEENKTDGAVDPAASLPTPPHTTTPSDALPSTPSTTPAKRSTTERKEAKDALDAAFLATFDPHTDWLPRDMTAQDYTPEFCRTLERIYWRNCSLGKPPWYGADMKGSLFTEATQHWNVATLPSVLSRLLGDDSKIAGVNTPYLYFGMWRATFAWHVEDMDLFSINYIHFGSPKHWYSVPQARAQALETTMKGYFPLDNTTCPQFLRHKSCLASPTLLQQSSVRPNTLVQHAGEFVVTFPRGYHAGFNLGFNCAESVNFALESWVELGLRAAVCQCEADTVRIDVKGLLEAKARREREGTPATEKKGSPSRKRRVEVLVPDSASKPKRPKIAKAPPDANSAAPTSKPKFPKVPKPKPADAEANVAFPCCLCASMATADLLRVQDPPLPFSGVARPQDGVWRAHEACARVIPETWVDEVGVESGPPGAMEKVVWGVDGIVRDRWALSCAACTRRGSKAHGAPIQCTKGKCSKAFHVSCAAEGGAAGVAYRVVEEVDKEVLLLEPEVAAAPKVVDVAGPRQGGSAGGMDVDQDRQTADPMAPRVPYQPASSFSPAVPPGQPPVASSSVSLPAPGIEQREGPRVIKTIKKLLVEVLCAQHNPVVIAQKKASKNDKVRADLAALPEMSRIRIRNQSGVFEVSLVKVWEERGTVEVLWDGGQKREFRWGSIVWGSHGQTMGSKPTAEELASQQQQQASAAALAAIPTSSATRPLYVPTVPTKQQQPLQLSPQYNRNPQPDPPQYAPPSGYTFQPHAGPSRAPQQNQGMSQFRAAPQPVPTNAAAYEYSQAGKGNGAAPQFQGYYPHPYYQHQYAHGQSASSQPASAAAGYSAHAGTAAQAYSHQAVPVSVPYANYYTRQPYLPLTPQSAPPKSASPAQPAGTASNSVLPPPPPGATSPRARGSPGPPSSLGAEL